MKFRQLILCFLWIVPLSLCAQSTIPEQLQQALRLERQGQYAQAVSLLQPIAESGNLSSSETDRIWTQIGYAQQEQGNIEAARRAYEQAIQLARTLPASMGDYPTALDNLADLDQAGGDLRSASRLEHSALRLFQKSGDHAGTAWALTHLAVIDLTRKDDRGAQRELERAAKEAEGAADLGKDYYASQASAIAWLAELEGDPLTATAEYRRSIVLQSCSNCALTGWRYVLLGKAYAESGELALAQMTMRSGLTILASTAGEHAPKYLAAELAYARVLDKTGAHSQAAALKISAQKELNILDQVPCRTCRDFASLPW